MQSSRQHILLAVLLALLAAVATGFLAPAPHHRTCWLALRIRRVCLCLYVSKHESVDPTYAMHTHTRPFGRLSLACITNPTDTPYPITGRSALSSRGGRAAAFSRYAITHALHRGREEGISQPIN